MINITQDVNKSGYLPEQSIFELAGGAETFRKLSAAFYRRVETDALLRPMYPKHLKCAEDMLAQFLAQFFGGPADYSALRGHPRLRLRHARFRIGEAERDAWLVNMYAAMDEVGIEEPIRTPMRDYFIKTANFLINTPEESGVEG